MLHGDERSDHADLRSRSVEKSVLRMVPLAPRIREARTREVCHVVVRQVADRFDEFKRSGFEDEQARVIAMAIDETVEDRLEGVVAPIVARLDGIDAQFKAIDARFAAIDTRFAGIESQLKGISERLNARKFEIAAIVITSLAALIAIGFAAYEHGGKQLLTGN